MFQQTLETTCAAEYDAWVSGNYSILETPNHVGDGTVTPGETVVQCVLEASSDFVKANMASAGVLLGITPFALSVLGSSSEESALLYVISRRPLLTSLLLAGAPVVTALRPFEYKVRSMINQAKRAARKSHMHGLTMLTRTRSTS